MVTEIFLGMGFTRAEGPEVELADYNFTRLNTDEGHPAREWSDTFYLREDSSLLLRTQTSPMQIRVMESHKPPIRIVAPGRVYRKDEADATHSPMFHQIEGMVVDKGVTMADLKGTLNEVVKSLYGEDAVTRFRPHHFPFTEPSCEVDVQCFSCKRQGLLCLQGRGLDRGAGRRYDPPQGVGRLRHRHRCVLWLGLWHGRGTSGHDALWLQQPEIVLRERCAVPGTVLMRGV